MNFHEGGIPDSIYDAPICSLHDVITDKKDRYNRLHKVKRLGLRKSPNA